MGTLTEGWSLPAGCWEAVTGEDAMDLAMAKDMKQERVWVVAIRVVSWYLALGAVWILCSDVLLDHLVHDQTLFTSVGIAKGWLFLLVTGALLFELIRRSFTAISCTTRQLAESEAHYRILFDKMENGFALLECVSSGGDSPADFRFLQFNPGYERISGHKAGEVLGRTVRDVFPGIDPLWLEMYGRVALTGVPACFGGYSEDLGRYYEVNAYSTGERTVAVLCTDVTEKRRAEVEVRRLNKELEQRVAERTAQYAAANEALKEEIRQRMQAEEEISWLNADLVRQKTELEAANRELEAFSFSVSHDLRAPLRHVSGFARILQEDYADTLEEAAQEYLHRIDRSCRNAERLIDELLQLSRISRSAIRETKLDLSLMAREVIADLDTDPGRKVSFKVAEGAHAFGDETLMRTVLANLIGNAYKYTGKRIAASVEFGSLQGEGGDIYYVRDNGAGFDMRYAAKLFAPFQRLHRAEDFEGTGVGLAIVQRVIRRHGGEIWAAAELAQGATFFFTLGWTPTAQAARDERAA